MTVRLPSDLMARSADEAARILALSYLRQIEQARTRLEDPEDREALHDFRVGIRRLRSCIRAYRPQLKRSLNQKSEQSLRKLMRATNAGRDTEVQLTWLRNQGERLQSEDTQGLFWLIGRLEGFAERHGIDLLSVLQEQSLEHVRDEKDRPLSAAWRPRSFRTPR